MRHALPAALILLLAGTAPALAQPHADCLRVGQVRDFQPMPDNRTLIVTDNLRHKYKVSLLGVCPDLKWRIGLGFHSRSAGSLSCLGSGDEVIMRRGPGGLGGRCPIQKIVPYTHEMERADAAAAAAARANR